MEKLGRLKAAQIMTSPVLTVHEDQTLLEAATVLLDGSIHGAAVVDERDRVTGVLSLTDVARYEREREPDVIRERDFDKTRQAGRDKQIPWSKGFHIEAGDDTRVADVMTPAVISVREDTTLAEVVHKMLQAHVHRVMVAGPDGRTLVGVVSETDVVRAVYETLSDCRADG
jgi:CBS domain-containing protein